jgi:hypothetical protein
MTMPARCRSLILARTPSPSCKTGPQLLVQELHCPGKGVEMNWRTVDCGEDKVALARSRNLRPGTTAKTRWSPAWRTYLDARDAVAVRSGNR